MLTSIPRLLRVNLDLQVEITHRSILLVVSIQMIWLQGFNHSRHQLQVQIRLKLRICPNHRLLETWTINHQLLRPKRPKVTLTTFQKPLRVEPLQAHPKYLLKTNQREKLTSYQLLHNLNNSNNNHSNNNLFNRIYLMWVQDQRLPHAMSQEEMLHRNSRVKIIKVKRICYSRQPLKQLVLSNQAT